MKFPDGCTKTGLVLGCCCWAAAAAAIAAGSWDCGWKYTLMGCWGCWGWTWDCTWPAEETPWLTTLPVAAETAAEICIWDCMWGWPGGAWWWWWWWCPTRGWYWDAWTLGGGGGGCCRGCCVGVGPGGGCILETWPLSRSSFHKNEKTEKKNKMHKSRAGLPILRPLTTKDTYHSLRLFKGPVTGWKLSETKNLVKLQMQNYSSCWD